MNKKIKIIECKHKIPKDHGNKELYIDHTYNRVDLSTMKLGGF